jgi:hypothetical protein
MVERQVKSRMFDEPVTQILSVAAAAPEDDFGTGALAGGAEFTHAVSASELQRNRTDPRIISTA